MKKLLLIFILLATFSCDYQYLDDGFRCPLVIDTPSSVTGTLQRPFQGDILINPTKQAGVITELWKNRVIPILFDERYEGTPEKELILQTLNNEYEPLGFTFPVLSWDEVDANTDAVFVKWSGIAASYIGHEGGIQDLYLPPSWNSFEQCIVHEFGHAVGLHHPWVTDKQRDWLTIYKDNIRDEAKTIFRTYGEYEEGDGNQHEGYEYGDHYDIYSVMNYASNAYAIDPEKPTMTLKDGTWFKPGDTLSAGDIQSIQRMYECYEIKQNR